MMPIAGPVGWSWSRSSALARSGGTSKAPYRFTYLTTGSLIMQPLNARQSAPTLMPRRVKFTCVSRRGPPGQAYRVLAHRRGGSVTVVVSPGSAEDHGVTYLLRSNGGR